MDYEKDTICAIATPHGIGGIGIIRISGQDAFNITDKIFKGRKRIKEFRSHSVNYGYILDNDYEQMIDEVMIIKMDGPKSFTKEDVIEINCHGSPVILKKVIELLIREGCRAAEPGEFTRRAFLNGRIDLSEAEAVSDIINSQTSLSLEVSFRQLKGGLSKEIKYIRRKLIGLIAQIEATLDFPEEDLDEITQTQVQCNLESTGSRLEKLYGSYEKGKYLKNGIKIVIAGRPNVGKSSLLNELTGYRKAIVTEIPGTTRDLIEETIYIKGIPVTLIDTAGIRNTGDIVEKIGVELAKEAIDDADMVLVVVDSSQDMTFEDEEILKLVKDKKVIVVINKIDLLKGMQESVNETRDKIEGILINDGFSDVSFIKTSLTRKVGLSELEKILEKYLVHEDLGADNIVITSVRHAQLIGNAIECIKRSIDSINIGMPLDVVTVDVRSALDYLGQIIGEYADESIMNEIFSRFCIGK